MTSIMSLFAGKPFIFREKIPWEQAIPLQLTRFFSSGTLLMASG